MMCGEAVYQYGKDKKEYEMAMEASRREVRYAGSRTKLPPRPLPPPPGIIPPMDAVHALFFEILEHV